MEENKNYDEVEKKALEQDAKAWNEGDTGVANQFLAEYFKKNGQLDQYFAVLSVMSEEEYCPSEALEMLAECYEKGIGVTADAKKAEELKEEAELVYSRECEMEEMMDAAAEAYD